MDGHIECVPYDVFCLPTRRKEARIATTSHGIAALLLPMYVLLQNGRTPLMTASFEGHVDIVRILIKAKAQVNIQDEVCCYYHTHVHHTYN